MLKRSKKGGAGSPGSISDRLLILLWLALFLRNSGRFTFIFRPLAHDLYNLPNIGTLAFLFTGTVCISFAAVSGTVFAICFAFRKYRAVIEILEMARRNSNGGLTGRMVKQKKAQLKITEINLIAHKNELNISQEFFTGQPGIIAAGTFFKYWHIHTMSSRTSSKSLFF